MTKTNASKELVDKIVKIYQAKEVREKDVKEIKDLIDRGANVNTYINEYGTTLLHCAVFKDISPSRLMEKVVKMIIKAGFQVNATNCKGEPSLFFSSIHGIE